MREERSPGVECSDIFPESKVGWFDGDEGIVGSYSVCSFCNGAVKRKKMRIALQVFATIEE